MSHYRPGDVVLAPVRFHRREESVKMRPAVVIEQQTDGRVIVCPVTSRQPDNSPHLSLGLDDFATGGLNLFEDSYVLLSERTAVTVRSIAGKKGRLNSEWLTELTERLSRLE